MKAKALFSAIALIALTTVATAQRPQGGQEQGKPQQGKEQARPAGPQKMSIAKLLKFNEEQTKSYEAIMKSGKESVYAAQKAIRKDQLALSEEALKDSPSSAAIDKLTKSIANNMILISKAQVEKTIAVRKLCTAEQKVQFDRIKETQAFKRAYEQLNRGGKKGGDRNAPRGGKQVGPKGGQKCDQKGAPQGAPQGAPKGAPKKGAKKEMPPKADVE